MQSQGIPTLDDAQIQERAREGTWLGNLPTIVRAGWDQLSPQQKTLIRSLRNKTHAAGIRGVHPAEPEWDAAVELLRTVHDLSEDVAVCIAFLADRETIDAGANHVHTNIHRFKLGASGGAIFTSICKDWSSQLAFRAKRSQQLAARRAREEQARLQKAADAAQLEEQMARAKMIFAALHPLGEAKIRRLIDRAVSRMAGSERACTLALLGTHNRRIYSAAPNKPASLLQSPQLREIAYAEFTTHGTPGAEVSASVG